MSTPKEQYKLQKGLSLCKNTNLEAFKKPFKIIAIIN